MISVSEALTQLFKLATRLASETVPLREASGRVLAQAAIAGRDQPPFAASAMDGYAVRNAEVAPGASFHVIGEAAAGHAYPGAIGQGEAVRIFTGAPLPEGANRVVIQEDVVRDGETVTLRDGLDPKAHVRPKGGDFAVGASMDAPRRLSPSDIALLAAMNVARVEVTRRPVVALLSTGDELVMPGEAPDPAQIIASNTFGLAAMLQAHGAEARILPIARDARDSLAAAIDLANGADLLVTIGGASVGDHDLVADVAADLGMERAFYKVAMRPGKPLMAGRMGSMSMVGLPGNPVSAMVCGEIFLRPVMDVFLGFKAAPRARQQARLASPLPQNGPREHYMRAHLGATGVAAFDRQDSSLLTVLADANCMLVRPPHDPERAEGEEVEIIPLTLSP